MKTIPNYPRRDRRTKDLLASLLLAVILLAAVMALSSCGGTFTLSPAGVISYTTPVILKAPIVEDSK